MPIPAHSTTIVALPARLIAVVVTILVLLGVSGCAVQLAPSFDRSIVDGLVAANEQAATLFAAVEPGTRRDNFAERAAAYGQIIGKFDALRIQAQSRPVPRPLPARLLGIGPPLDAQPSDIPVLGQAPSIAAMQEIVEIMSRMREHDMRRGLTPMVVEGYKNAYEISINQALVYEKALER